MVVIFPNLVAKSRIRKDNLYIIQVGNDIALSELSKMTIKSAYEQQMICNSDAMVFLFFFFAILLFYFSFLFSKLNKLLGKYI